MQLITSPAPFQIQPGLHYAFLAGSIEMGTAPDWQAALISRIENDQLVILNPRRSQWDPQWSEVPGHPMFRQQVEWELEALEQAHSIWLYFAPGTQSPVTLLEMGLHARAGKLRICCPEGFWRRENVRITAQRYQIPLISTLDELADSLNSIRI